MPSKVAAKKIEYYIHKGSAKNRIHLWLAEHCRQFDVVSPDDSASDADQSELDDFEVFQEVLQGDLGAEELDESTGNLTEITSDIASDTK